MLVAPCSIKTLSGIAHCYANDLIVRAADVCLKERRRVVLMVRETPLHAGHIALMDQATRNGAIIMPPGARLLHIAEDDRRPDRVRPSGGRSTCSTSIIRWCGAGPSTKMTGIGPVKRTRSISWLELARAS